MQHHCTRLRVWRSYLVTIDLRLARNWPWSKSSLSLRSNGINRTELLPNTAILSPAYKIRLNHYTKKKNDNEINRAALNIRAVTVTDNTYPRIRNLFGLRLSQHTYSLLPVIPERKMCLVLLFRFLGVSGRFKLTHMRSNGLRKIRMRRNEMWR